MKTILAAFCDSNAAQQAIQYLRSQNVTDIQLLSGQDGNLIDRLNGFDIPAERAQLYAEVTRRGAPLLIAHTDHDARSLANDLDRMGSLDLDAAEKRWRKEGWNGYDSSSLPYDAQACAGEQQFLRQESQYMGSDTGIDRNLDTTMGRDIDRDLEVVEEKVSIGKRQVQRGGVRVRTFVTERPIHEQVQLREERVEVRREPVNERIAPTAMDSTLGEDEFVVTAQGEEAVVGKEARVVERVHVGKVAETRTETIEETERRRDVEVEQIEGSRLSSDDPTISRR